MQKLTGRRKYDPHETARAEALRGTPLATFPARAVAFAVDMIPVVLLYTAFEFARQLWFSGQQNQNHAHLHVEFDFHHPASLVWAVLYFGLSVYFTNGLTLGKRMVGIRAVSLVHDRFTLWQSAERALGYGASALEAGFGFLQFFIHRNRQCVHDRIAETIVIKMR